MAKTKISEFSSTPANNTDIDSINIAEGCAPSNINDAIRELMAQLKDFQTGAVGDSFNGPVGTTTAAAGAFTTLSASSTVTLSGGTANGVTYLNGSKVLTSGSALTFDGTNFASTGNITSGGVLQALTTVQSSSGADLSLNANGANRDVIVKVNGTEQARFVGSTGNLGIGTSSPQVQLHLQSSAPVIRLTDTSASTDAEIFCNSAAGSMYLRADHTNVAANSVIGFQIDGSDKMTLDSAGNLGLGVSPSAWGGGFKVLETQGGSIGASGTGTMRVFNNVYYNGTNWIYKNTATASRYELDGNSHVWYNAPSGTAGNAITFTQAMTLDATSVLSVLNSIESTGAVQVNSANKIAMSLESASTGRIAVFGADTSTYGTLVFSRAKSNGGTTESARIDSSGNLLVGTTVNTPAQSNVSGFKVGGGQIECNGSNTQAAFFGRSNDGQVVRFYNAGSAAGNISNSGTTTSYNGTSDYRLKENVQPMVGALIKVLALKPCTFTWKNDGRFGQGFIAHELQEVVPDAVQGEKDAIDENGNPEYQGIDPRMVVATLTAALQELNAKFDAYVASHP